MGAAHAEEYNEIPWGCLVRGEIPDGEGGCSFNAETQRASGELCAATAVVEGQWKLGRVDSTRRREDAETGAENDEEDAELRVLSLLGWTGQEAYPTVYGRIDEARMSFRREENGRDGILDGIPPHELAGGFAFGGDASGSDERESDQD